MTTKKTPRRKKAESEVEVTQVESLTKAVRAIELENEENNKRAKNKVTFSTQNYSNSPDGTEQKGVRRVQDSELREIAHTDPYISAIISTRAAQGQIVGRPSDSKFDKGTRLLELHPLNRDDFSSDEEFNKRQEIRKEQMKDIMAWFQSCGTKDKKIINSAYSQSVDKTFKTCSLADFVSSQIENLLTFGRFGTQIFRNEDGIPYMFRPVPIETFTPVKTSRDIHISMGPNTHNQSHIDAEVWNDLEDYERPAGWVQKIDGRTSNPFTEDDLKVGYWQKQALFDLNGYPLAPIERAIYMVFIHQNTLGYLKNQFVKGLGSKGILSLQSTDVASELSNESLDALRSNMHNFLSRNDNSASTPIISGPVSVNWIPLTASPRDMEFLQVEEHVVRALCSAFQVSPQEMGYGHLGMNQGGLTSANKQEEIIRGEEKGLRNLLDSIYDQLNEILYDNFPQAAEQFRLTYVGVGEDTRDAVIQRHVTELQTTATMSSLWSESEKNEPIPVGGNVPLADIFHRNVVKYMKYGDFMEKFFGFEGWSKKPEYDFIIDPNLNQAYQAALVNPIEVQQQQTEMGLQQQQFQLQSQQMQMEQAQQRPEQPQTEQAEQPTEAANKSLKDAWVESQTLQKSIQTYFGAWMEANK